MLIFTYQPGKLQEQALQTNLDDIAAAAAIKTGENELFRDYLYTFDSDAIDAQVHALNEKVAAGIDCTSCGNCCRSFMINVSAEEAKAVSDHLALPVPVFKEKYIEESTGGRMIIKSIPCLFLTGNKCSIYEHRFSGCREFPYLDQPGFTGRLFGVLMYYATCPIIFNVVEQLKQQTAFKQ